MATPDPDPTSGPSGTRPRPLPADTGISTFNDTSSSRNQPLFIDLSLQEPVLLNKSNCTFSILQPVVTIELLGGSYCVSARFNLQTSINKFQETHSAKHARFFHSVALRYLPTKRERFDTEPGADPCGSYTVTDSATSERQIETSVTGKLSPEGTVRARWTKSAGLTVERKISTWSLSTTLIKENIEGGDRLSHEWYWRGTQYIANRLSPDHLESVTRVILVTRKIEAGNFPPIWVVNNRTPHEREQICKDLIQALTFEFEIKVYDNCYVKELGHGINRLSLPGETSAEQLFERRSNGGKFLNPIESKTFFIGPDKEGSLTVIHKYGKDWPTEETISLKQKEAELESKYSNSDLALRELTLQSIGEYVQLVSGASGNGKAPSK